MLEGITILLHLRNYLHWGRKPWLQISLFTHLEHPHAKVASVGVYTPKVNFLKRKNEKNKWFFFGFFSRYLLKYSDNFYILRRPQSVKKFTS
jgi:hypothetical protein